MKPDKFVFHSLILNIDFGSFSILQGARQRFRQHGLRSLPTPSTLPRDDQRRIHGQPDEMHRQLARVLHGIGTTGNVHPVFVQTLRFTHGLRQLRGSRLHADASRETPQLDQRGTAQKIENGEVSRLQHTL